MFFSEHSVDVIIRIIGCVYHWMIFSELDVLYCSSALNVDIVQLVFFVCGYLAYCNTLSTEINYMYTHDESFISIIAYQ